MNVRFCISLIPEREDLALHYLNSNFEISRRKL